jgi:hypothetical protein
MDELYYGKCLWPPSALDIEEPQVILEVSIAILEIVFKGSPAAGEGLLHKPLEGLEGGDILPFSPGKADPQDGRVHLGWGEEGLGRKA